MIPMCRRFLKGGGRAVEEEKTPVLTTGAGTLNLEAAGVPDDDKAAGDLFEKKAATSAMSATKDIAAHKEEDQGEKLVVKTELTAEGQPQTMTKKTRPTFRERIVGAGYKQVCGRADVWGDGVVPEESAYLEGAVNILLDGVYHSPVGASDRERPWYGSAGKIDQWVHHLLHE